MTQAIDDIVNPIDELMDAVQDALGNGEGDLLRGQLSRALEKHNLVVLRKEEFEALAELGAPLL